jgi:uncharacterized protein (TIGR02001 family)
VRLTSVPANLERVMRNHWIGLFIAAAITALDPAPARASDWGNLYGYVDWTTDYRFYAMSSSGREPTPQGGLHWAAPDNYYLGVFISGVRFQDYRSTSYETDFYGGRHFYFDNNDLNLELLFSAFPDTAGHPTYTLPGTIFRTYNFFEGSAELTHSFGALSVASKVMASPEYGSHTGALVGINESASYAVTDWLKASASWGHQWVERGTNLSHWDIGATATWRLQWVFDLRYYGSDISPAHCFSTDWCKPALVAKVTYQFQVL